MVWNLGEKSKRCDCRKSIIEKRFILSMCYRIYGMLFIAAVVLLMLGSRCNDGLLLVLLENGAWAEQSSVEPQSGVIEPERQIICRKVTLKGKGKDYLVVGERHFKILPGTVIKDVDMKDLSLDQLEIPCEADVCYFLKPNQKGAWLASITLLSEI